MPMPVSSVMVDDQEKALQFYTRVLGFVKKLDIPLGEFRWLTVVSPDAPDGVQLLLEPNVNPAARTFQQALFGAGDSADELRCRRRAEGIRAPEGAGGCLPWRAGHLRTREDRPVRGHVRRNLIQLAQV